MIKFWRLLLVLFLLLGNVPIVTKAATSQITVSANKKEYLPGERVSIKGLVKQDGIVLSNVDVTLRLEYQGMIVQVDQTKSTSTGFSFLFGLANDAKLGEYKVVVQGLGIKNEVLFRVSKSISDGSTNTSDSVPPIKYKLYTYKNPLIIKNEPMILYISLLKDLNTTYNYNKVKKTITIKKNKTTLVLTINNTSSKLDGKTKKMTVAPIIKKGKLYLPAAFVSKSLGGKGVWDKKKKIFKLSVPVK
jgi:hypothetical protein